MVNGNGTETGGFRRSDPCVVSPISARIFVAPVPDQVVAPGSSGLVQVTLTNEEGAEVELDVAVSDARGFTPSLNTDKLQVPSGAQGSVFIRVRVPASASDGDVSRVTFTAVPPAGFGGAEDFVFTGFNIIVRDDTTLKVGVLSSRSRDCF